MQPQPLVKFNAPKDDDTDSDKQDDDENDEEDDK
jgi:hypothetical protein